MAVPRREDRRAPGPDLDQIAGQLERISQRYPRRGESIIVSTRRRISPFGPMPRVAGDQAIQLAAGGGGIAFTSQACVEERGFLVVAELGDVDEVEPGKVSDLFCTLRRSRGTRCRRGKVDSGDEEADLGERLLAGGRRRRWLTGRARCCYQQTTRQNADALDPGHDGGRPRLWYSCARRTSTTKSSGLALELHPVPVSSLSSRPRAGSSGPNQ